MTLAQTYKQRIVPALKKEFGFGNNLAAPRLIKATVNVGVGRLTKDRAYIDAVADDVRQIAGQKPVLVSAKKSIAAFKIRQGDIVGVTAVLRGGRMYDFVEKLIRITLPRVRDFRGLSEKIVDQRGNLSLGFKEHTAFAEIITDEVDKVHGLEVTLTTNARNHEQGLALFKMLGFPFRKDS